MNQKNLATTSRFASSPAADCVHHSERTHGQTHGQRKHLNRGLAPAHGYRGVSSDDPGRASHSDGNIEDRHGDSLGLRGRSLLFVTQRSDWRPCGAATASQRNHQGSPARRQDRRLARGQFPLRYRKPRQETLCPLREDIFRSRWYRQNSESQHGSCRFQAISGIFVNTPTIDTFAASTINHRERKWF